MLLTIYKGGLRIAVCLEGEAGGLTFTINCIFLVSSQYTQTYSTRNMLCNKYCNVYNQKLQAGTKIVYKVCVERIQPHTMKK